MKFLFVTLVGICAVVEGMFQFISAFNKKKKKRETCITTIRYAVVQLIRVCVMKATENQHKLGALEIYLLRFSQV